VDGHWQHGDEQDDQFQDVMTMPASFDLFSGPLLPALMFAAAMLVAIPGMLSFARGQRVKEGVDRRLQRRGQGGGEPARQNENRIGKAMLGFASSSAPSDADQVSAARAKLIKAGYMRPNAVGRYYFARLVCVVIPQIALLFALPYLKVLPPITPLVSCLVLILLGLAVPTIYVDKQIEKRRLACSSGFPDMMDLLVACVEAGLSLDAAVQRVGEELELRHPIIAMHMRTLSLELRAGKARKIAWRSFADRMGLDEAGSLATMLRQAEEMGTSLGQTLRVFSADMRQRRILYAEEKAMALPAKLTIPLIFFVFPVLLGVLTLPAVVKLQVVMQ
jgi:tight adherence protein C